jgi:hypothetical protein
MKHPHRGAMLLIALLMAASLVSIPPAGGAVEPKLPMRVPDNPPGEQYGEPDVPPHGAPGLGRNNWIYFVLSMRMIPPNLVRIAPSRQPQPGRAAVLQERAHRRTR